MTPTTPPTAPDRRFPTLPWALAACVLLTTSGLVRAYQDRLHRDQSNFRAECPIALKELPAAVGTWKVTDQGDQNLDPQIMRIAGATDHLNRTYVDEMTGVSLQVLVIYGPAEPVLPHTPEICYPSSGYTEADPPRSRGIAISKDATGEFRSAAYIKKGGLVVDLQRVYYAFYLDGRWSPDLFAGEKLPRQNPGIFKIQIQRRSVRAAAIDDDPIEQFLKEFLPIFEGRVAAARDASPSR